MLGNKGSYTL
ncbi:hypothetical protein YPPY03_4696, partial [Yersinia pestis PY-03]